jgi:hypothetical protein
MKNFPGKGKDKIVFFNYPFSQSYIETFKGYSDASKYRTTAASLTAKKGGKFAIIRSLSSAFDDVPHTGAMRYQDDKKIPAVAIGNTTADELEKSFKLSKGYCKIKFQLRNERRKTLPLRYW